MQPQQEKLNSLNGKKSLSELKDTLTDVDFQHGMEVATQKVKQYSDAAYDVAKKNPVYVALGAAGIGLLLGGLFVSSMRRK